MIDLATGSTLDQRLDEIRVLEGRLMGIDNSTPELVQRFLDERTVECSEDGFDIMAQPFQELDATVLPGKLYIAIEPQDVGNLLSLMIVGDVGGKNVRSILHRILTAFGEGAWSHEFMSHGNELVITSYHTTEPRW